MNRTLTGALLVATPVLTEPRFDRTVILLIAHEANGALGVVLNRVSEVPVRGVLREWADLASEPSTVFTGGPVAPEAALCLALLSSGHPEGWTPIDGGLLGTVDLAGSPARLERQVERLRVFAGYAGWGAGQLEAEVAQNAWVVVPALPDDPFSDQPSTLWRRVLRRQRGLIGAMATYPPDPSLN